MKKIKALLCMVLCMCLLPSLASAAGTSEGSCGENLTWKLNWMGTLTISGTGDMADYGADSPPWYSEKDKIKEILIGNGVTSIGSYAFHECPNLTKVDFPRSLEKIGNGAFRACGFTTLKIPVGVKKIGEHSFLLCRSLVDLTIPESVEIIDNLAFEYCTALKTARLPKSIKKMGYSVFRFCESLKDVYYAGNEEDWNSAKIEKGWAHLSGEYTFHFGSRISDKQLIFTIGDKTVFVNGEPVENDVAPQIVNGRTMLPVRFLSENLGSYVYWDPRAGVVTIIDDPTGRSLVLTIGSEEAVINHPLIHPSGNYVVPLDAPAFLQDGRTFLPIRFITEALGCYVEWTPETQQVMIERY